MAAFLCAPSHAAFNAVVRSTFTAEVIFTLNIPVGLDAVIYNMDGTVASPQEITWDDAQITPGTTGWKAAKQYVMIYSTLTAVSSAVQIYTDNCAADADPQFYTTTPVGENPAGLVRQSNGKSALSMCWRLTENTTDSLTIGSVMDGTAMKLYSMEISSSYPCFLWMKDKSTPDMPGTAADDKFVYGEDYCVIWEENRGCQHAEGTWSPMSSPNFLYLGADFSSASTPETYQTSNLRIELFTE